MDWAPSVRASVRTQSYLRDKQSDHSQTWVNDRTLQGAYARHFVWPSDSRWPTGSHLAFFPIESFCKCFGPYGKDHLSQSHEIHAIDVSQQVLTSCTVSVTLTYFSRSQRSSMANWFLVLHFITMRPTDFQFRSLMYPNKYSLHVLHQ